MNGPLIVLKFGGTALGSSRRIRVAARRLSAWRRRGFGVIAVASATGHTTDRIFRRLEAVGADPGLVPGPETDRALATGELLSSALLAAALEAQGTPARSLSGRGAGLLAGGSWGAAVLAWWLCWFSRGCCCPRGACRNWWRWSAALYSEFSLRTPSSTAWAIDWGSNTFNSWLS